MWNCSRRFWVWSRIVVNSMTILYGLGMILYCLWLLKKWQEGTATIQPSSFITMPLFILTCLAVGIGVCLGTIGGYMYLTFMWCLLFLEVAAIVNIYFRMDWLAKINKYIDEKHSEFKSFVLFHLRMCRVVLILSLVPQVSALAVANILQVVSNMMSTYDMDVADFHQSFLEDADSPEPDNSDQICSDIEFLTEKRIRLSMKLQSNS
ncbi:hypothetical protein VNO77_30576 [Canavalia gladiata]|uniref:Uncharacterized protein n=1 Tax=Canavalia gladiata TaxID=3824 RepID=A0AAN9KQY7_CANGL